MLSSHTIVYKKSCSNSHNSSCSISKHGLRKRPSLSQRKADGMSLHKLLSYATIATVDGVMLIFYIKNTLEILSFLKFFFREDI